MLEHAHPALPNKKIDTFIPSSGEREGFVLEFKYDRNAGPSNSPRTMKAGKVINDLYRLDHFRSESRSRKWMVYLSDEEMAGYFLNKNNGLYNIYNLREGDSLQISRDMIDSKPKTFLNALTEYRQQAITIQGVHSADLPRKHKLRVYEVL